MRWSLPVKVVLTTKSIDTTGETAMEFKTGLRGKRGAHEHVVLVLTPRPAQSKVHTVYHGRGPQVAEPRGPVK